MRTICLALALLALGGCTATQAIGNARALGDRTVDRVRLNLDTRDNFYRKSLNASEKACDLYSLAADGMVAACMSDGGCDLDAVAYAYKRAARCYREEQPSIVGIRQYRDELRGAFE